MDITKVVAELRQELANLDAAISTLERLQQSAPRRRGRPTKSLAEPIPAETDEPGDRAEAAALKKARRLP
jgi:hypothetical protein